LASQESRYSRTGREGSGNFVCRPILYVGYDPNMRGGVTVIFERLRSLLPELVLHASVANRRGWIGYVLFSALAYPRFLIRMWALRPNIVHILFASPCDLVRNAPYLFAALALRRRVIVQFRYDIGPVFRSLASPVRWTLAMGLARADVICFLSEHLRSDLVGSIHARRTEVLPNPAPPGYLEAERLGYPDRLLRIVFLGRWCRDKGLDVALQVAEALLLIRPDVEFVFYGDGVIPASPPRNCRFAGWVEDPEKRQALATSLVLILPTRQEAFGNVIIEAMACGTPVMASPVGGVVDLIEDGRSGFLIPLDNVGQYVERLILLLDDRTLWDQMSKAAKSAAWAYDLTEIARRWKALYRSVR
jgi:glycosyltransferase involved in cell wall biosynthesis